MSHVNRTSDIRRGIDVMDLHALKARLKTLSDQRSSFFSRFTSAPGLDAEIVFLRSVIMHCEPPKEQEHKEVFSPAESVFEIIKEWKAGSKEQQEQLRLAFRGEYRPVLEAISPGCVIPVFSSGPPGGAPLLEMKL